MDWQTLFADPQVRLALAGLAGVVLGVLIAALIASRRLGLLRTQLAVAEAEIQNRDALENERQATIEQAEQHLTTAFRELAGNSLRSNNETFLALAREHLGRHQEKASGDLKQRQQAIEGLLTPIKAALDKTEQQIANIEKDRKEAYGGIREQLVAMSEAQTALQAETRNLVRALRRPEVRGQWGEMTLRRLAELAGLVERCDFEEQTTVETDDGRQRPDMIVNLPNGRQLVVDVKTPLDAYLNAVEAEDDAARELALKRHADNVRQRVSELAKKSYWSQFENSPEFVILFIPGDQFLSAALQRQPDLLENALHQKVILATPTSLVALLKAVAYGWRQVALEENAKKIQGIGEDLYQRLAAFSTHLSRLGRQLGGSVDAYNSAVGSLERMVLPGARKFREMGVASRKDIEDLPPLEQRPRKVESAELLSEENGPDADGGDADAEGRDADTDGGDAGAGAGPDTGAGPDPTATR
jgi:DNA recombination protein RmuC